MWEDNSDLTELVVRPLRRQANPAAIEEALTGLSYIWPPNGGVLSLEWSARHGISRFSIVAPRALSEAVALQIQSTLGAEYISQPSNLSLPEYGAFIAGDLIFDPVLDASELRVHFDFWNSLLPCKTRASGLSLLPFPTLASIVTDGMILLQLTLAPFESDARLSWLQFLRAHNRSQEDERSKMLHACITKVDRACWLGNLRAYVSAPTKTKVAELFTALSSTVAAAGNPEGAVVKPVLTRPMEDIYSDIEARQYVSIALPTKYEMQHGPRIASLFTPAEVATFWQPVGDSVYSLAAANARVCPAPPRLVNPCDGDVHFGIGVRGSEHVDVYCPVSDLFCHCYIRGMTGAGKTSLISQQILAAFRTEECTIIALTAKSGEAQRFLGGLEPHEVDRVLLLDQTDYAHPFAFNLLDTSSGGDPYLIAEGAVGVLRKLFAESWGFETERLLRNGCLTLAALPGSTLLDLHRLLTDANFRHEAVACLQDAELRRYWEAEFERYDERLRQAKIAPALNKLWAMLANPHLRAILSQPHSTINIPALLESGKLILLQLDHRQELSANLLGALFLTALEQAAMARIDRADARPAMLFIDEFQNLTTESLPKTLAEARAAQLYLRLIHQYGEQVERRLLAAILANCAIKVFFRCSYQDALEAQHELMGEVSERDLQALDRFTAYVQVVLNGVVLPCFTLVTEPLQDVHPQVLAVIQQNSREQLSSPATTKNQVALVHKATLPKGSIALDK